ncbi:MAG TPA: VWA domain-containing protein [Terriglobales bacterium]|nr:VWA domain-containing protein [Terriglobales bacterium]
MHNRNFAALFLLAAVIFATALFLVPVPAAAQSTDQQQIPDAPSATRPFPKPSVSPTAPPAAPGDQQEDQTPAPPPNITTVPPGGATKEENTNNRDELFTLTVNPTFVNVPVTVRDDHGGLVAGLLPKDFAILEDGKPQKIAFFTSDPFPLTAAVVLDLSMPDTEFAKVRETLPALVGAFGQFDEVSLWTYGTTVSRVQGFVPAQNDVFIQNVKRLQHNAVARAGGVPVTGGPMASGPSINGMPADPGAAATVNRPQMSTTYRPEAHVLNDAILAAAQDMATRDRTRRKVMFVISNGRELRSDASYSEVLKVLLTQQITVYAVSVGESAIPIYDKLNKIRIPGQGYGDILPKYANATGGQVFSEFSQHAIETAYNQATVVAKNQYTLGYYAPDTKSSAYRNIEVRVFKPDLKVITRAGYYPLPPMSPRSR